MRIFATGLVMGALIVCALTSGLRAQDRIDGPPSAIVVDGSRIIVRNIENSGMNNMPITVETEVGPVSLWYHISPNHAGTECCPDTAEVTSLPAGYVAVPPSIEIEEQADGEIRIEPWRGS